MAKLIALKIIGPSTGKLHGWSIDRQNGVAYHVLPLDEKRQSDIDKRFIKLIKRLLNEREI